MMSSRRKTAFHFAKLFSHREADKMNRLPPRDLNGLLKFCIESTRAEDASGNLPASVRAEDITPGKPVTFDTDKPEHSSHALGECHFWLIY